MCFDDESKAEVPCGCSMIQVLVEASHENQTKIPGLIHSHIAEINVSVTGFGLVSFI